MTTPVSHHALPSVCLCIVLAALSGCFGSEPPLAPHEALAKAAERIDKILQEDRAYGSTPGPPEPAQTPNNPSEVTFWFYAHPLISPLLLGEPQKRAAFANAHPEVTLNPQFIGDWSIAIQKYTVSLAAGDLPDIGMVKRPWLARLIPSGRIAPLDEILPPEFIKDFRAPVRDTLSRNGHLYALPADGFCNILYYNKNIVQEPAPRTWDELRSRAKEVLNQAKGAQEGIYPIGYTPFLEALWSAGGEVCTDSASSLTSPEAGEAIDFIVSLRRDGLAHPTGMLDPSAGMDLFLRGRVAMTVASSELLGQTKKIAFPAGIAPVPGKTKPISMLSDSAIVVFARYAEAKKPAIANVLDFLTSSDVQGEGSAPTRESVAKILTVPAGLDPSFQAARNTPLVSSWASIEFELTRYLDLACRWEPAKQRQ